MRRCRRTLNVTCPIFYREVIRISRYYKSYRIVTTHSNQPLSIDSNVVEFTYVSVNDKYYTNNAT